MSFTPFNLALTGTGVFRPDIFFLELSDSAALLSLKKQIDELLCRLPELAPSGRSFVPHITLARFKKRLPPARSRLLTQAFWPLFPLRFKVEKFVLYRSRLEAGGAVHTPLKEVRGL